MKKITVYEASKQAAEIEKQRISRIHELIIERDCLAEQLKPKIEKDKYPIELEVKSYSCFCTREYLKTILKQIEPISDVINLSWKRR